MCQFVGFKITQEKGLILLKNNLNTVFNFLHRRGDKEINLAVVKPKLFEKYENRGLKISGCDDEIRFFIDELTFKDCSQEDPLMLLFFSRQAPEMETTHSIEKQPYFTKSAEYIAVHGTIYNDSEIINNFGLQKHNINIDTELFMYLTPSDYFKLKGLWAALMLDPTTREFTAFENGIKIHEMYHGDGLYSYGSDKFKKPIGQDKTLWRETKCGFFFKNHKILSVAFSSGLDITLSLYEQLRRDAYNEVILNYFNWHSAASEKEIESGRKLWQKFKELFPQITFKYIVHDFEPLMNNYFKIVNAEVPKIARADAEGSINETESPIAYVPYRNTFFGVVLAAQAENYIDKLITEDETMKNKTVYVDILFGLNLSEGMVFGDNSKQWLDAITEVISSGGKEAQIYSHFRVVSPFVERTKTNMLKEVIKESDSRRQKQIKELIELSYSCYYPKTDGSPCGKCGSCLLREKALARCCSHDEKE